MNEVQNNILKNKTAVYSMRNDSKLKGGKLQQHQDMHIQKK